MILAGDVGGTKVHLALYSFEAGRLNMLRDQKFPAAEHESLDEICLNFLGEGDGHGAEKTDDIVAACFGCPGPVRDNRLKLTNLPWVLDARDLQRSLGIGHIFLINDLEANGYGIPEIATEKIVTLHEGDKAAVGHRGLVSAGTGLGEALLIWNAMTRRHLPIPSEGGHCDFAARNDREVRLFQYLHAKFKGKPGAPTGRISFERVASGIGLKDNVYEFLRDREGLEEPQWLRERMAGEDPNAVIGTCAEDGSSPLCYETMQMFTSAYGAEAGNVALKVLAVGGIYLGGGIAPKILKTMQSGAFMEAFLDKGRMSPILDAIPVRIILDDTCALLGAAAFAEARASELSGRSERAASVTTA